VPVVIVTY